LLTAQEIIEDLHRRLSGIERTRLTLADTVTDHGGLTGLADNDHPQYSLTSHSHAFLPLTGGTLTGTLNGTTLNGTHTGDGAALTGLNASNLGSGTVASARLAGAYTGITNVGTLAGLTSSARIYSQEWIHFDNSTGLYSPINGAHFRPNPGSYGAWQVLGSRNGWYGIEFGGVGGGDITLMVNNGAAWGSQTTGMHNNAQGWIWNFSHQTLNASGMNGIAGIITLGNFQSTASTSGYQYLMWGTTFGNVARFTSKRATKDRIAPLVEVGAVVDALRPVSFIVRPQVDETPTEQAWREADVQHGFIAEDVAQVDGGRFAVWEPTDDGELVAAGWRWPDMIALLVAEVQSLRTRLAAVEAHGGVR
jgi:hypothetical protein